MSPVTCHLSPVNCHLTPVKCPMSCVTCHMALQEQPQQQTLPFATPQQCTLVGPKIPFFFSLFFFSEKIIKKAKTQNVYRYAKICDTPFEQRSLIHRKAWFPPCFARENQQKNKLLLSGDFTLFINKSFQI